MKEYPGVPWQKAAEVLVQDAKAALWANEHVLGYLRDVRGLTDATIERFDLGYAPYNNWGHYMVVGDEKHWYPSGILIPWRDGGVLHQIRVRTHVGNLARHLGVSEDAGPEGRVRDKYMSVSGSKAMYHLFNVDDLKPNGWALIVEGEFDAMVALQEVRDYSVLTIGSATNRLDDDLARELSNHHVMICLDNDKAGQEAAAAIEQQLVWADPERRRLFDRYEAGGTLFQESHPHNAFRDFTRAHKHVQRVKCITLPSGKDVTDFVMDGRYLAFWLEICESLFRLAPKQFIESAREEIECLRMAQRFDQQHRLNTGISFGRHIMDLQLWIEQCRSGMATLDDLEWQLFFNSHDLLPFGKALSEMIDDDTQDGVLPEIIKAKPDVSNKQVSTTAEQ